jgi:DNA polymerase-3 subunit delta
MFYVFHGEDEFSQAEELARLRGQMAGGDPAMAELNTTILDGKGLTMGELRHVCDSIPFMAERRLILVHGLLSWLGSGRASKEQQPTTDEGPAWKRAFLEDLAAYLPALPPTTRLFFLEGRALLGSHPILKLAKAEEKNKRGFVRLFDKPKEKQLPSWIEQRARDKGGTISREAVLVLAALIGNDLRLLDQEIEKLLVYTNGREIGIEDVQALVSRARQTSIFDLVDCVGRRETDRALRLLHRMLDDEAHPLYLLTMLARQVRILIQVKELQAQGRSQQEIANELKLHPYVVGKGLAQARNFDMAELEAAHERLVETDWAIKTGAMEEVLALDTLVVELTQR